MPEAYSWETREAAEELFIIDGLTYEQVAERTTVSVSQLKRWGGESGWVERRREYRQAQTTVRRGVMLAKAKAINSVLENMDPQVAYAFSSLVASGKIIEEQARENAAAAGPALGTIERPIKTAQDAVEAMQEALQRKINAVLGDPSGFTLEAIKGLRQAMEIIEALQAKYLTDTKKTKQGLSGDAVQEIRKQILGIDQ
ncbi:MAG: hypothetical protein ACOY3Z_00940 [Thermodesulfobacteriota bacterium]